MSVHVILGSTQAKEHIKTFRRNGWGRMFVMPQQPRNLFEGERWGLDNGAFIAWKHGTRWDEDGYRRYLDKAMKKQSASPYMAVLPDIVAGGKKSLDMSAKWMDILGWAMPVWPWYLAVQDGMRPSDTLDLLPRVKGLFLGGSDDFKVQANVWADFARTQGKLFHYARAGTKRKLKHAFSVGADSLDSAFPFWKYERMEEFERWWKELCHLRKVQLLLPWQVPNKGDSL